MCAGLEVPGSGSSEQKKSSSTKTAPMHITGADMNKDIQVKKSEEKKRNEFYQT
jgi:hypothetical protein